MKLSKSKPKPIFDQLREMAEHESKIDGMRAWLQKLQDVSLRFSEVAQRGAYSLSDVDLQPTEPEVLQQEIEAQRAEEIGNGLAQPVRPLDSIDTNPPEPTPLGSYRQWALLVEQADLQLEALGAFYSDLMSSTSTAPLVVSQLVRKIRGLKAIISSSLTVSRALGGWGRDTKSTIVRDTSQLSSELWTVRSEMERSIAYFEQIVEQNPRAEFTPTDQARLQAKIEELEIALKLCRESSNFPKKGPFTLAFFAKRHGCTPRNIRSLLAHEQWQNEATVTEHKPGKAWIIKDWDFAKRFDGWVGENRRKIALRPTKK